MSKWETVGLISRTEAMNLYKKGKPQTVKAKYVVVWGKQSDGKWKALVDAPTTTH